jgi:hypothetical protein
MGRGLVWCGDGPRRLLNRIFLMPGRIWLRSIVDRAQEGAMPGILTNFLLWQKPPGRLNGGNSHQNGQFTPKRIIGGPNSPQNGPKSRNFGIVQIQDAIARSKNLAKFHVGPVKCIKGVENESKPLISVTVISWAPGPRSSLRVELGYLASGRYRYMLHNRYYTRTGPCVRWGMAVPCNLNL